MPIRAPPATFRSPPPSRSSPSSSWASTSGPPARQEPSMRSSEPKAPLGLTVAAAAGLIFMLAPLALIFLYAFSTEERTYRWPPPGLTLDWFAVTWGRVDVWQALTLSVQVASISTLI